jgi:hypothetical protein
LAINQHDDIIKAEENNSVFSKHPRKRKRTMTIKETVERLKKIQTELKAIDDKFIDRWDGEMADIAIDNIEEMIFQLEMKDEDEDD